MNGEMKLASDHGKVITLVGKTALVMHTLVFIHWLMNAVLVFVPF